MTTTEEIQHNKRMVSLRVTRDLRETLLKLQDTIEEYDRETRIIASHGTTPTARKAAVNRLRGHTDSILRIALDINRHLK